MRFFLSLFIFNFLSTIQLQAQEISALVIDSQTRQPIPYATVQYAPNKGVITNDEGRFSVLYGTGKLDSLEISSLGYNTLKLGLKDIKETIYLKPSSIELKDVFLSNKNLTGKEIVKRVKDKVKSNYNFNHAHKRFFFRESNLNSIKKFDLLVEKSTIPELNQNFFTSVSNNVPKTTDSYKEVLGDFYGNYSDQKLKVVKAANLHNPQNTQGLTDLMDRLEKILKVNIKNNSVLKIKSGIIGFKMGADEFTEDLGEEKAVAEKPKEKTEEEKEKELADSMKSLKNSTNSSIKNLMQSMFWKEDVPLDVFEKSNKYNFSVDGYTQIDNSIVYIIFFEPKRGADFKGKIYVNTSDFGVHRLEYTNVKALKKFRLFGISTSEDVLRGKMIFSRDDNGKYNPSYLEQEKGESFGVDRPLTIIEKNKFVGGRRKQNELDLEVKVHVGQIKKYQLVVFENAPIEESTFKAIDVSAPFEFKTFKVYNPEFWNGHNIIEPNAAIKAFTALEELM